MNEQYGDATARLLNDVLAERASHAVALIRHSAREFAPGRHDLENPLTPEGRDLARRLGERLPKHVTLRGYASPPARCMDTAELVLAAHREAGGAATRHRPVEGLGVFYALDQMKMWKNMSAAGGLVPFVQSWVRGAAPADAMIPADVAARLVLRIMHAKLAEPVSQPQLDLCVSHDMTLYLLREVLLDEPADGPEVRFLDALVLYEADGDLWLTSHHGAPRRVSEAVEGAG
jgi:broad specificity phosphatase PhoE